MAKKYSDDEKNKAVEMASEVGIPATIRNLGYPAQWITLKNWCDEAGVEIVLDDLKSKAAEYNQFYHETELIIVHQEIIARGRDLLANGNLTGGEYDKIVNGIKKSTEMIQVLRGKPSNRTSSGEGEDTDAEFMKLFEETKTQMDKETILSLIHISEPTRPY